MTKSDLIEDLAKVLPTKKDASEIVNRIFYKMLSAIKDGEKVVITGFGSFNLITTEMKKGRNPKTGESLYISPKKKIKFKQSKEIFNV